MFGFGFQICPADDSQSMDGFCSRGPHSSSASVSVYSCPWYPETHTFTPYSLKETSGPNSEVLHSITVTPHKIVVKL